MLLAFTQSCPTSLSSYGHRGITHQHILHFSSSATPMRCRTDPEKSLSERDTAQKGTCHNLSTKGLW
ncbi:hypothetical protein E2C01_000676 [Portunus trituberculatus]|uniref:Uncharacterized protein n=1 Tax=Portunus trituberculatus TaxID=210409 RepID=A0A5B7CER0_PORTR|nr:hypothetical protein [Portunus trituberculatus]